MTEITAIVDALERYRTSWVADFGRFGCLLDVRGRR